MEAPAFTAFSSGLNILLQHPVLEFSRLKGRVSHPNRTTRKIMVRYILAFTFLDRNREHKQF
jgi:hypothetical protein